MNHNFLNLILSLPFVFLYTLNQDKFSPYDGQVVKFADQYSAYLETTKSIEAGISSVDLIQAQKHIVENYKNIKFDSLSVEHLFI
jgi:putative hydrolase of HD superfamily